MKKEQGLYRFKREDEGNYILKAIFGDEKVEGAYAFCKVTICKMSFDKEFEYTLTRKKPVCHLVVRDGDILSVQDFDFELEKVETE